jgi:aryl-phospho-beta-D-glucosidase BglC (GH1 family)
MHDSSERTTSRRALLRLGAATGAASMLPACGASGLRAEPRAVPAVSSGTALEYQKLPRWRGFNLLEKFTLQGDAPYQEWDFDFLAQNGFDFVRLPTDYRIWTAGQDEYREAPLKQIDQAIAWGRARKIHVNLCLHRAPGYCVNPHPPEALDLFGEGSGSDEARRQFAHQWGMFAARYRGIAATELSFNLVNEPSDVSGARYARAAGLAVEAIRAADPGRLVIADGSNYGRTPVIELVPLRVAQSTRGYAPFHLTHYRAHWVEGSDRWEVPVWPVAATLNRYLYGTQKSELKSALVLRGDFPAGSELALTVEQVSQRAKLVVRADGDAVLEKTFEPAAGQGEWKQSVFQPQWQIYQATYDRTYTTKLRAKAREIRLELTDGDWLTWSALSFAPPASAPVRILPNDAEWGVRQQTFEVDAKGGVTALSGQTGMDRDKLYAQQIQPWVEFAAERNIGIHVGEWGAYDKTPHEVVLAWMRDCLANWHRAGLGWALWNLRGDFGCFDSRREDVTYEPYQGKKLDRRMLELLKGDLAVAQTTSSRSRVFGRGGA